MHLRGHVRARLAVSPVVGATLRSNRMGRYCLLLLMLVGHFAFAQQQVGASQPTSLIGTWIGQWSSTRGRGRLEFQIDSFDGEHMSGRVNSEAQACTIGWTPLSGSRVGDEIHASYTIGPPCKKVEVVFSIPKGNVIEGKWTSEFPGWGTFRLAWQDPH